MLNHEVGSLAVKDHGMAKRARSDEDRLIDGLKWSYGYFDHDHIQLVPEIRKEEEKPKEDLLVVVPDEHSETDDHHHIEDFSDDRCYLRNKHENPKKRRIQISSDEESEDFTREVPSVTRKGSKRRRRDELCEKMRTLQQIVPNCYKADKVSVLDKAIEYMKNLQLQLQVMSIMGMNPYSPPATFNFGMQNHLFTAMALAQGQNQANHTTSTPLIQALNWPLPPLTNLLFPHSSNQSPFLTTASAASSSSQCLCGLVPCFPSPLDFPSRAMGL
ncbi:PREDICTED: transcription factor HFR1-like [Camelina sativa]|uniref:Transcription factor HFR1-like n=1 Tax=Camelina sativa TaxID=90675 RepID=A0ABM0X579_CAMSA|nr:PREDICTED: transcription factor HFR1-like [Camelina sativa]